MNKTRVLLAIGFCLFVISLGASARGQQKARPVGDDQHHDLAKIAHAPGNDHACRRKLPLRRRSPHHPGVLCLTQAMIDKFGAPTPQSHNNQCQISNVHLNPGSMTADWAALA